MLNNGDGEYAAGFVAGRVRERVGDGRLGVGSKEVAGIVALYGGEGARVIRDRGFAPAHRRPGALERYGDGHALRANNGHRRFSVTWYNKTPKPQEVR